MSRQFTKAKSRLARLFDGWQAALALITGSLLLMLLVVPRSKLPEEIPLPIPNMAKLNALAAQDNDWARQVESDGLPFEVRRVGDTFRRFGLAAAAQEATADRLRTELSFQLRDVRDRESLLKLRAYQTREFLGELELFEDSGTESRDLTELGGEFVSAARSAGWLTQIGNKYELRADTTTRRALFRKRWVEVFQLHGPGFAGPFDTTIDEERAIHAFLFRFPPIRIPQSQSTNPNDMRIAKNEYLLKKLTSFAEIDRSYPIDYARALMLLRLDHPQAAIEPLARYLENNPDGRYTLHARNALMFARNRAFGELDNAPLF
ncbi:MAG: hypothetical protein FWD57_03350 [Polyangiaceae bacterium]|nr:hypothetical protein [Polyangiaceae bacterium]